MKKLVLFVALLFSSTFWLTALGQLCPCQLAKLLADDGSDNDRFGVSVAIDSNRILVGAHLNDEIGNNSGAAYIYEFNGATWEQAAKLTASDGDPGNQFGRSVSLHGDRALVGAWLDADSGINSGSAYIFELKDTSWVETKLTASDTDIADIYGYSVALMGNRALVGAPQDDENANNSGSVYIYEFNDTSWVETKLTASDGGQNDDFGFSVAMDSNRILVGAYGNDGKGSAYIYDFNGTSWVETKLTASDGNADDDFGWSVSLDGNRALIGAAGDDALGDNSGSAYVFELTGTTWTEVAKLTASDGAADDRFGFSASLSGDRALIGAYKNNGTGSAYVFEFIGSSWVETQFFASDSAMGDEFGRAVAIEGDRALVGAQADNDNGSGSGSAYIFTITSPVSIETLPGDLVQIHPNPFQNLLEINWGDFPYPIKEVRLMNLEGKILHREVVPASARDRHLLSMPELPPGIYLLEVRSSQGRIVKRVARQ